MKTITTSDGYEVIVDDDYVQKNKLRVNAWGYVTRAKTIGSSKSTSMPIHVEILERIIGRKLNSDELCDHVNRNRLDCRKENLRLASKLQNNVNREKHANNTSGFKGVCWDKGKQKWLASIGFNGRNHFLGRYADKIDAAKAYDDAAREYYGEFAVLNFPKVNTNVPA